MLRSLNQNGKPKDRKDMSKGEVGYLARAKDRDETLQINAALHRKQREEAKKTLGL